MKKILILGLVVVMALSAFGGFAYAQAEHEAVKGDKLVGLGAFGLSSIGMGETEYVLSFTITNPDCVGTITLEQLTIYDSINGVLIYEGPVVRNMWSPPTGPMQSTVVPELGPHEVTTIFMPCYFPEEGEDPHNPTSWMSPKDAREQTSSMYTVEITWSAEGWNCPLIGRQIITTTKYDNQVPRNKISDYQGRLPMESMRQRQD